MALLSGTITYRKYRILDEVPRDFKERMVQRLPRHCFREINPETNPERSLGWVNPFSPLDAVLNLEKVLFGKYILLGLRKDEKRVPPPLLKARLTEAMKHAAKDRKGRRLGRDEIAALKETVKMKALGETSPVSTFQEAVWDYETQEVYFSSQATKPNIEFSELFEETFELALEDQNLVVRTERNILENGLQVELDDLDAANFAA